MIVHQIEIQFKLNFYYDTNLFGYFTCDST